MQIFQKYWVKISVFNLFVVALLGVLMRYKIAFDFPYLEQKNVLHSHSHFAFAGWISQTLFLFLTHFFEKHKINSNSKKYHLLLAANLICAYGMLVAFLIQGYAFVSIFFSTLSIVVTYLFAFYFIKETRDLAKNHASIIWFRAALFFNIISSLGTFYLAYMMMSKNIVQDYYLSSIYFYLHFQYNGWFFFAIVGLFIDKIKASNFSNELKVIFWALFSSGLVTYFLSILWIKLPLWIYAITIIFTLLQTFYWFKLFAFFKGIAIEIQPILKRLLVIIAIASNLKFLMQLGLIFPDLNTLVFGTRIIVIAYLHLVLLGIITVFLLYYFLSTTKIVLNKLLSTGLTLFVIGIILNEIVLFTQGGLSFLYILFPFINELLFGIGIVLFLGSLLLFLGFYMKQEIKN